MHSISEFIDNNNVELKLNSNDIKCEKILKIIALCSWGLLLLAQIVMILLFDGEQISDAKAYVSLAKNASEQNVMYPSYLNSSEKFVFGNGFVNLLILIFKVTDNLNVLFAINIFATQLLMLSSAYILFKITKNKSTIYWFIIYYSFLTTFWSETVCARTEIIFTSVAFFAVALAYGEGKHRYFYVGIILALANWVRPLGIAFLMGIIIKCVCDNAKIKSYVKLFSGYVATVLLIGVITYAQCGSFIYQSTTFGYNLLMSANDDADGSFMDVHTKGKVGYIPPEEANDMSFKDFDEYYVDLSIEWIKENPGKYIMQIPNKLFYLFATETYSGSTFFNNEINTGGIDYIKSLVNKFRGNGKIHFGDMIIIFNQLWYMIILVLFVCCICILIKRKAVMKLMPLLFILMCGTGITILVVGGARYHFPYLPIFIMGSAITSQLIMRKIKK